MTAHAAPGDWLIVQSSRDSHPTRRAAILAVASDGSPPFTVRWLDTGREAIVFPGPDAQVVTAVRQAELDQEQQERVSRVQSEISHRAAPRT